MKYLWALLILLPVWLIGANLTYTVDNSDVTLGSGSAQAEYKSGANWVYTTAPGSYRLPVKSINLILPPDAEISSTFFSLNSTLAIPASQPLLNTPFTDGRRILAGKAATQPHLHVIYQGRFKWGDVTAARFAVYPYLFDPAAGVYDYATSINLTVSYTQNKETPKVNHTVPQLLKQDPSFVNRNILSRWYPERVQRNYDYLVVTTPELFAAAQNLAGFRQSQGLVTQFANITDILASSPGADPATKLRNYLISEYQANGFTYLLLIGDLDLVPVAYLNPEQDGLDTVPSDFYYSDLSSDFDSDQDGRLGEIGSGMDYTPEVIVGRIPWDTPAVVNQICNRIVSFESTNASWKHKALLPAAILNYAAEDDAGEFERTDGATFMEYCKATVLRNWQNTTMYEQAGVQPSLPSDHPLKADTLSYLLDTQSWGLVNWSAHGSPTTSVRKVWIEDSDNDQLPDAWEIGWGNLVDVDTFNDLLNQDGSVYFCASCLNGSLDYEVPSLGEVLLKQKAVADIAATRTGWYKLGWANPGWGGISSYNYHFLENYADNGMTVGMAHAYTNWLHTQYCLFGDPIDTGGIIWPELQNIYTMMLFGDPAIGYPAQTIQPAGNILVWEPVGNTGTAIVNALHEVAPFNVVYTDHLIDSYDYLNQFDAVFCLFGLGYGQNNYQLSTASFEYGYLLDYLQQGGKVYMEGMIGWDQADSLFGYFGTIAPFDHVAMIEQIRSSNNGQDVIWDYNGYNGGTQALATYGDTAQPLFWSHNQNFVNDVIGVWNRTGETRTISSSFNLGGVYADSTGLTRFMAIILDTLGVYQTAPVPNQDETVPAFSFSLKLYPNPFRSDLRLSAKTTEKVKLSIYNIKGQLVKTAALSPVKGEVAWQWDGRDKNWHHLAAGIYLLKADAGNLSRIAKILKLQ